MFCPTCKSLLTRKLVRGKSLQLCPVCDGVGPQAQALPGPWWKDAAKARGPDYSDAARAAVSAMPSVPASTKRAKPQAERRPPKDIPPPDDVAIPAGADLFPFGRVREGQRQFIADVAMAARDKLHLLAHAPTGLGKTVSTLAPLVQYALANKKRVFFLTSKQSQHKIAIDTLKAIREKAGVAFTVADIIGKQDMCPRAESRDMFSKRFAEFCKREQVAKTCEYWENTGQNGGAIKLLKQKVHHVEELVITATDCTVCPHQTALDLGAQAHVVVCDYNYFFSDMRANMQERLKLDLAEVILVVDEAHNLPDRIRDHLALSINEYMLDEATSELKDLDQPAMTQLVEAIRLVVSEMADEMEGTEKYVTREEFVDAINNAFSKRLSTLVVSTYQGLVDDLAEAVAEYEKRFKTDSRGLQNLHEFLYVWKIERRGLARVLSREPSASLSYKMLDAALLAKPVFDAVHASVVMSGTLHPMEMTRDVLGLDPKRTMLREYASPFPQENRLVIVDGTVTTGYKERTSTMYQNIGERLASVALATPGNVAAFFPSYAILDQVRPYVEVGVGRRKEMIVEERGLDKNAKENLIQQMRSGVQNALLLGVQGGSLSEGYDYEDNLLKGVVIVGLPFAAPSLEVEALIQYYEKKFGPGLGRPYAYVHPTFHRVLQAAGRCIRSGEDRGVIVLMDKRFGWGSYRASYPNDFRPKEVDDVGAATARFWATRR